MNWTRVAPVAVFIATLGASVAWSTTWAEVPSARDSSKGSPSGSYLAGRAANLDRDAGAAAAYYRAALRLDPKNSDLLELAFYSLLAEGNVDEAVKLADRVLAASKDNRNARLVLGVHAIKQKQYAPARKELVQASRGPINDLLATLLTAWSLYGAGDARGAVAVIDKLQGADWYGIFKEFHAGLILDLSGNRKEAGKRLERAFQLDSNALRIVEAYGRWASRNLSKAEAAKVYERFSPSLTKHPLVADELARLAKGEQIPQIVDSPQAGAAEALYGLGSALGRREEELSLANRGLAYLQLALYLDPSHQLSLVSLADIYEAMKKPQLAFDVYERIPESSPLKRISDIQAAVDLDSLDRTDEAKQRLQKLVAAEPAGLDAILALGNILRERKQYAECAEAYGKGVAAIKNPEKSNWTIFYFRGICHERAKNWSAAEADLKKALELYPDQPHVLNYLGYSWVDQGKNLDEGMRMIKRSVEQRPDDGYIVDSLGWAYFRIGNYEEAAKSLDRAVELKPTDPTINDHLGDAYWRVGRTLEARFQWAHARDLKPEPDELKKIEDKIKNGLPEEPASSSAEADKAKKSDGGG
jgi:tetratricopeptide (TPR) repeat protein